MLSTCLTVSTSFGCACCNSICSQSRVSSKCVEQDVNLHGFSGFRGRFERVEAVLQLGATAANFTAFVAEQPLEDVDQLQIARRRHVIEAAQLLLTGKQGQKSMTTRLSPADSTFS